MQPRTMQPKLTNSTQTITFSEGDGVSSSEVISTEVMVTSNAGNHNHGSSKVKLKNLVDYNWEPKFYPGQLLAVHISGKYLAYSIKAPNAANPGTWNGMVRVVYNPEPDVDRRTLIKGMKGEVQDLAFAHIQNEVVLACIDEQGNFYVHEIEITDSCLRTTLILEVREDTGAGGCTHRVVWCPYIPDEGEDASEDDAARLLLTTHANIARMWNVRVLSGGGAGVSLSAGAALAGGGARAAAEHGAALLAAAFSPDGSALATASADGYVMFFQVYTNNEKAPRCLHKWQPHDGKPLSSLFFLDNHKNYNTDVQFWKYAVTGADSNTSIKVWSCKSWSCLQTITFAAAPGPDAAPLGMKAALDVSATYLLLADFRSRCLYVLHMARNEDDSLAYCTSISEFLLPYPVLSFCIVDAEEIQPKCESSCDEPYPHNGDSDPAVDSPDEFDMHEEAAACSGTAPAQVRLRLYIVQPKGLQEGELLYEPVTTLNDTLPSMIEELSLEAEAVPEMAAVPVPSSILQQQSQQLKNLLMRSQTQPGSLISQRPESPPSIQQFNLMTPDAFSSPGKRDEDDPPLSATPDVGIKPRLSINALASSGVIEETGGGGGGDAGGDGGEAKPPSGGSSPSREVQQIMAQEQAGYYKDLGEDEPVEPVADEASGAANEPEPLYAGELFPAADKLPPPPKLTHSSSETAWPQISIAQITEANQRKACSDKASGLSAPLMVPLNSGPNPPMAPLNPPLVSPVTESLGTLVPLNHQLPPQTSRDNTEDIVAIKNKMVSLEQKLDKLLDVTTEQSVHIQVIRDSQREHYENSPRTQVDEALEAHTARTATALRTALSDGWEQIARLGETAGVTAAQAAGAGAARALEPLAAAMRHELAAKMSATDQLLRENIEKLVHSKTVCDRLSAVITQSLSEVMRDALRGALADTLIPLLEKAHAQIFLQVNQAFQAGTKEFVANTEVAARAAAERGGAAAVNSLRAALERHTAALAHHAPLQPEHYAALVREMLHNALEKELVWWREQVLATTRVSRAHSPSTPSVASVADRQMQVSQIQSLLASGDANGAFQLALSASELALVVAACRAADPARVFAPPCRLQQHVLLSLVQQLSADMAHDTDLKYRYLEEAIMNLDTSNPVTREHLPTVVRELQKQITAFINANPAHALTRQYRVLLMATDSLVKNSM